MNCQRNMNEDADHIFVYLPVSQSLNFRSLLLIDGFIALDEGQVGLWRNMGGSSVSTFKLDYVHTSH